MHFSSVSIVVAAFVAVAAAAAVPVAEAEAKEIEATKKRELTNIRPLLTRTEEHMLFQRTYPDTPTSGPDAGKCGATAGYTCTAQMGPCCGGYGTANNKCGDGQSYCAGACQPAFGWCTEPGFQIAFDVDNGDVMWDPVTDNVFDANMGDGMIYFGYPPLDPDTDDVIPWPSTI